VIAFLEGTVAGKTLTSAYVNVNGVGFEVGMSSAALAKLPETGQPVSVFTYLQVRDDGMALFGFLSLEEKALFEKLIAVSGIGPKVALAALSSYSPDQLIGFIAAQDVAAVQRIPGVGKKTASRIILELKGSFDADLAGLAGEAAPRENAALAGAREALLSMGFTATEADLALKNAPEDAGEGALLQYALKKLGSR